jgi:hypothetical protein
MLLKQVRQRTTLFSSNNIFVKANMLTRIWYLWFLSRCWLRRQLWENVKLARFTLKYFRKNLDLAFIYSNVLSQRNLWWWKLPNKTFLISSWCILHPCSLVIRVNVCVGKTIRKRTTTTFTHSVSKTLRRKTKTLSTRRKRKGPHCGFVSTSWLISRKQKKWRNEKVLK